MIYSTIEEKNLLTDAYEQIDKLYNLLNEEMLMKTFHIKTPLYCFTNFKDAVFHFFQLSIAESKGDKLDQYFALKEHITRATKDYFTCALNCMNFCLEKLIEYVVEDSIRNNLRKVLHLSKDILFTIRFSGMLMTMRTAKVEEKDFEACIQEFIEVVKKHNLSDKFNKFLKEYRDCQQSL